MFCEKCGTELGNDAEFCHHCGAAQSVVPVVEDIKKKRKWPAILAAAMLLLTAVILLAVFFVGRGRDKEYEEQIKLAERYLNELDYDRAAAAYNEAIGIDPERPDAYEGLAELYAEQGDVEKALDILNEGYAATKAKSISGKQRSLRERVSAGKEKEEKKPTEAPKKEDTPSEREDTPEDEVPPEEVETAEGNGMNREIAQAYLSVVKNDPDGLRRDPYTGAAFLYGLLYIDEDDIPELVLYHKTMAQYENEFSYIYFYRDGEVVRTPPKYFRGNHESYYYEKKDYLYIESEGAIEDEGFVCFAYCPVLHKERPYYSMERRQNNGEPDADYLEMALYRDGTEISKDELDRAVAGLGTPKYIPDECVSYEQIIEILNSY